MASRRLTVVIDAEPQECGACRYLAHTQSPYGGGAGRYCTLFEESHLTVIAWGWWDHGIARDFRVARIGPCLAAESGVV